MCWRNLDIFYRLRQIIASSRSLIVNCQLNKNRVAFVISRRCGVHTYYNYNNRYYNQFKVKYEKVHCGNAGYDGTGIAGLR
jgi:hypothetical protein